MQQRPLHQPVYLRAFRHLIREFRDRVIRRQMVVKDRFPALSTVNAASVPSLVAHQRVQRREDGAVPLIAQEFFPASVCWSFIIL